MGKVKEGALIALLVGLGVSAVAVGSVGLIALFFLLHAAILTSIIWLANFALTKVFAVGMLTLKKDFFLAASIILVKSIFSGSKVEVSK